MKEYIFEKTFVRMDTVYDHLLATPARTVQLVLARHGNKRKLAVVLGEIRVKAHITGMAKIIGFLGFADALDYIFRDRFYLFNFHLFTSRNIYFAVKQIVKVYHSFFVERRGRVR